MIEKLFKSISKEYSILEKDLLKWVRDSVRQSWSSSPMKRKIEQESKYQVKNTNSRSLTRYPLVWKIKCDMCGKECSTSSIELDHIKGENSLKSFADIIPFIKAILFPSRKDLQWLCKNTYAVVNGKKIIKTFGCHSIKTLAERNGITFEEAAITKEVLLLISLKEDKNFFRTRSIPYPSNLKNRRGQMIKILKEEYEQS